jgi:cobalt-zinc-cadmium efflux system membrane fusion protein
MRAVGLLRASVLAGAAALLVGCGGARGPSEEAHGAVATGEYERGPNRGRMLRDGAFALEVTIFEDGVDPEYRVYPYVDDKPIPPDSVQLSLVLTRLGNIQDRFAFKPQDKYLRGDGIVYEPHSFDVAVEASHQGKKSNWAYQSYEGRTIIGTAQAEAAGVKVEPAGPAVLEEVVSLSGRVELQPQGRAEVSAWYPGRIVSMTKVIGERVRRGETLARVTSSESLQTYSIPAPISGVVLERNANVGDVAGGAPLYVVADASKVHAEFFVYPRDAERLRAGQKVTVRSLSGERRVGAKIETILPSADVATQTVVAHVELPNADLAWRPGQAVEGEAVVATHDAPLAVRTRALQRFRDFTVVYARIYETYEVRMLELGRRTPEWTEVLGGIRPGEVYVSDNAFLVRADIEKTGASHDH